MPLFMSIDEKEKRKLQHVSIAVKGTFFFTHTSNNDHVCRQETNWMWKKIATGHYFRTRKNKEWGVEAGVKSQENVHVKWPRHEILVQTAPSWSSSSSWFHTKTRIRFRKQGKKCPEGNRKTTSWNTTLPPLFYTKYIYMSRWVEWSTDIC